jgi:hypothetical protein
MNLKGKIAGTIPYDFERPSARRIIDTWWNPQRDEIVVPRAFGVGWAINFSALKRRYPLVFWAVVGFAVVSLLAKWRTERDS